MLNEKLPGEDLISLQKEKGKICISIIVPTHKTSPERRIDELAVTRAVKSATEYLNYKYPDTDTKPLLRSLEELVQEIDYTHNSEGIGLYVSPGFKLSVKYPFPIEEKVIVGESFEVRDLLYKQNFANPYFVLLLSEKGVHLLEGSWSQLSEITDKNFPRKYTEEYIYSKPSKPTSYSGYTHEKGFEKDKSELIEIRAKDFFREADELLKDYLIGETPLVVVGVEKELSWFEDISKHRQHIIKKIHGNYAHSNPKQIADIVWPEMLAHFEQKRNDLIKDFVEKLGTHLGTSGIQDVWQAAKEGKALKLLVEKDYRCPGFTDKEGYHLYLRPPEKTHNILADAVDDLIEMVLNKNGQVYFTENGSLSDYEKIALITRY
ncbi:baeRF3 domain-containing protein [Flavihumibacter profundi]|jgi:hypothetical protein|uniref:baeRF3 domain-containing protein n=1 Tax=Flavihumibacter profundi TaxID=2716883 RepID=UPI001CC82EA6|nr:hypothetical protein [Flavihumibacter profundi]MBZ5858070.1 hypothetical protein [Flavihumibacter profundi]